MKRTSQLKNLLAQITSYYTMCNEDYCVMKKLLK